MLISQQRTAEADQLLAGWRDSQPYVPEAYVEQAWFQHETGNRLAAEQTLRQALQVKPNHPVALAHLGQLHHENGQVDQATAYYQRSLLSRWNQTEVRSRMATLTGSGSSPARLRRSAMIHNDANAPMISMNEMPMTAGQPVMTMGGAPAGEGIDFDYAAAHHQRRHHHHARGNSTQQLTAYPLPNYGLADAGGWPTGMMNAAAPSGFPSAVATSPTMLPEMTASQPVLAPPVVASSPTLTPQADPAHTTEITAGLPVVDPH